MTHEFWDILKRNMVGLDESDTILIPGANSAATSDPDIVTTEKEEDNYPIFIIPGVMGSLFPLAKEKVVSTFPADG